MGGPFACLFRPLRTALELARAPLAGLSGTPNNGNIGNVVPVRRFGYAYNCLNANKRVPARPLPMACARPGRAQLSAADRRLGRRGRVSAAQVAADKVKPDTWNAHLDCRGGFNSPRTLPKNNGNVYAAVREDRHGS
jgi:hypothetical protein